MSNIIPSYSVLYSISDLHLGGNPGRQIFNQGERLGQFVEWLAGKQDGVENTLALVLAGDILDSLPTLQEGSYVEIDGAASLVDRIVKDFPEVFAGLKKFVGTPKRELIVLLGNHDIELALPEAQEALLSHIAGDDAAARGRVRFETNGTGFRCDVSGKIVYVTHGNEADRWNHVDYEALRKAAHARSLGLPFDASTWTPNAGTKLVVDAMNDVKKRYPFVDLLKPETDAMLRILAALDEGRVRHAFAALPAFAKRGWAQTGAAVVLGATSRAVMEERVSEVVTLFSEAQEKLRVDQDPGEPKALFDAVRKMHVGGERPELLVRDDLANLGNIGFFLDLLRGLPLQEALRRGLKDWITKDRSFALTDEDDVCKGVVGQLGSGVDVVITGHTHLPRSLSPRSRPGLTYLNAGTWARVMSIDQDVLADENTGEFTRLVEVLQTRDMNDLDKHELGLASGKRKLMLDATLAARVVPEKNAMRMELVRVLGNGTKVDPVKRSDDVRKWQ